jgi:phosphoenolpyruvate carboxykinase (ATP)
MAVQAHGFAPKDLEDLGITKAENVWWNLTSAPLVEHALKRGEGTLSHLGPLVVRTGQHTGRSPKDKFVVREPSSEEHIWWGSINQPIGEDKFDGLLKRAVAYTQGKDLYVQECFAGADPKYRLPVRIITELAWHNLFSRNMFIRATAEELANFVPGFTVLCLPSFEANPEIDGTRSEVAVLLNIGKKMVLVAGTQYAGEIKKSIFTVMNYILPMNGVLSMHASANVGPSGDDTAVFFGLSGTGKTTLSADVNRTLIGDDEHGWSDNGVFNFEGGCYAKVINLSAKAEPEIYQTTRRFGTILENVGFNPEDHRVDLTDSTLTENTRAGYPIDYIPNASDTGRAGHPRTIVMLTADAFGVLPPISRLSPAQAMFHFLSGYTAKVAGTEKGIDEPQATFSACFGAPFLALPPARYAEMLGEKIDQYGAAVFLVNTGWSGGPYGVGSRMKIAYTRAMVNAAIEGKLNDVPTETDPVFGLHIPKSCPDVPNEVLNPRDTWSDKAAYDKQAKELAQMFVDNFKQFEDNASQEIRDAAPKVS